MRPDPDDPAVAEFAVRARVVVNATGVWADAVRALDEGAAPALHPSGQGRARHRAGRPAALRHRGGHPGAQGPALDLRRVRGPGPTSSTSGTTDTDYTGPLDDPACTPEDVDYLLDAANNVTTSRLTRADVTGVWAGLRPLLAPPDRAATSPSAPPTCRAATRCSTSPHGVVTVTGGKLTTYRKMAQDTVDAVGRASLGESPRRRRCVTEVAACSSAPRPPGTR